MESLAKVLLLAARKAQRSYSDRNPVEKEYQVGEWLMLKSERVSANLRADLLKNGDHGLWVL